MVPGTRSLRIKLRAVEAAMIIRSWGIIPTVEPEIPADIALVSENKAENLIGIVHTATFKVTDDAGLPVEGALVDFDAITDPWYCLLYTSRCV